MPTSHVAIRVIATCGPCQCEFRVRGSGSDFSCPNCKRKPDGALPEFWKVLNEITRRVLAEQKSVDHQMHLQATTDLELHLHAAPSKPLCPWCGVTMTNSAIASHLEESRLNFACNTCSGGIVMTDGMTWIKAGISNLASILHRPGWVAEKRESGFRVRCSSCNTSIPPREMAESACPEQCLDHDFHDWDFVLGLEEANVA